MHSIRGRTSLFRAALLLVLLLVMDVGVAHVQEQAPPSEPAAVPAIPLAIATGIRAVQDSAAIASRRIAVLGDVEPLLINLREADARQAELLSMLQMLRAVEHTRPERLFRLRDLALTNEQRLEQQTTRASERLSELTAMRAEWLTRRATHAAWEMSVPDRPELAPQLPEIRRSIDVIDGILSEIDAAILPLTELEESARELLAGTRAMIDEIAAVRAGRREALLRADQPFLFSRQHLASLRPPPEWDPGEAIRAESLYTFARVHGALLLLHLALIITIGLIARSLRRHTVPERGWSGVLHHPWAFGTFAATAFLARRYILAPPLWDVIAWTLLASSGAVLASMLLRGRALRAMILAVAAVYPLLLLGEALLMPPPLFRLAIATFAAAAVVGFPLLAKWADKTRPTWRRARAVLVLATVLSVAVLVAQLLGFDQLSRWLVHAILTSAYVMLSVAFLIVVGRGALRTLLRKEFIGRVRLVGTIAIPLAERLLTILQVVLIFGGALVLLDVWELAPAPIETWTLIRDWGFVIAGIHITVGRMLLAALLVYLALTASWLARTLVTEEAAHSWSFERGVADSINALVHYAVITLGVIFGLGALGVELQNFAIVAGALGVGIGFGLQTVVNNFVSGLILLFERPVRVGDTVEIDGEWGTIKKIGLRSTVVVTFTQAELIVPNADLVSQKVTNWTLTNPVTRLATPVGVAYGSDIQKVLKILVESAAVHTSVVAQPKPIALFVGFGDNSLDFELRVWVGDVASRFYVRSDILAEIDRRFREEAIEIPFPQRDLHIRSVDPKVARAALIPPPEETP
ncbi:hypothetical protein BH23GEM6_BH23GEM6_06920 [soil metagenome]